MLLVPSVPVRTTILCCYVAACCFTSNGVNSFASHGSAGRSASLLTFSSSSSSSAAETTPKHRSLSVPLDYSEMVRQVSSVVKEASNNDINNQIVRILLPRDANNANFGLFAESGAQDANQGDIKLVPPDESWQGGIMQLYRSCLPTAQEILQRVSSNDSGLTEKITEDRSIDDSGVDGVSLLSTPSWQCFVQPTQEVVSDYVLAAAAAGSRPTILINPQWRQVDDALDTASQGEEGGFLSGLASFLGGKGNTLKQLQQAGFEPTYTLEGYVCRGANVRLMQVLESDWQVFCERDNEESFVKVGTCETRPTYQQVEEMLNDSGIGYKYARDMGLESKL